ncbi:formate dehydrogenase accessory sulfurtransferase FdhD [Shewanella eurypsychrophilus]|uniref:Sulfur carrier protein FdhD n=1 Tax=Shewanella eurypsychrophilus TaxID=2593656 RepID=A0ABX6VAK0_9GAMM|nr:MULTISPECIES: formate dehydrogenase accessory sulfurtransferase FdhD [Shewanella]QFU22236.1 formate dehydrogenase accessory sulfurtransferase FdhD [Shewanella sp. YLB-09]QPG57522.1 formate dehydrogenase accessory sulfurtransferase FdhD [Shewanella eurypsychrophilus]
MLATNDSEQQTGVINPNCVHQYRKHANYKLETDLLVVETPIALIYNGISHVVLMCTSDDLEELAVGFSLTEGIIEHYHDIHDIEVVRSCNGIELHIELANRCLSKLKNHRRNLVGRTGCGICGTESLERFEKPLSKLAFTLSFHVEHIDIALEQLNQHQQLNALTGATHAAAYVSTSGELLAIREDVGRHIALDKLIGYIASNKLTGGVILVTSRASYEMVQKTITAGVEVLLAISAATEMAVTLAKENNLTLIGFCRPGRANIYSHIGRIEHPVASLELVT